MDFKDEATEQGGTVADTAQATSQTTLEPRGQTKLEAIMRRRYARRQKGVNLYIARNVQAYAQPAKRESYRESRRILLRIAAAERTAIDKGVDEHGRFRARLADVRYWELLKLGWDPDEEINGLSVYDWWTTLDHQTRRWLLR